MVIHTSGDQRVLIETYWNVKRKRLSAKKPVPKVLIETYWNVKMDNMLVKAQFLEY